MKKILIIAFIFACFFSQAQTIQNASIANDSTIVVGYIIDQDMEYKEVLKTDLATFENFVAYCNEVADTISNNFLCQYTTQQTGDEHLNECLYVICDTKTIRQTALNDSRFINFRNELKTKL